MDRYKEDISLWIPKTELGKEVFEGKIVSLDEIFKSGRKIKESKIVDKLLPTLRSEIIFIGGSPGKGGGSRKTPTKRTARMHRSGRRYRVSAMIVVGNEDGYFGVGKSTALEHGEAMKKATEIAKLNIIPVKRGCGSWECACGEKHSIPIEIAGKNGSVKVILKPAPKGIGLCINDAAKKIMQLAGIKDIWSKDYGESRSRINYMFAIFDAFKKMNMMKMPEVVEEVPEVKEEAVPEIKEEVVPEALEKEGKKKALKKKAEAKPKAKRKSKKKKTE